MQFDSSQLFPAHLPTPDLHAQQHSLKLTSEIVQLIKKQSGWISFKDYMQACLYYPGLGYYSAGSHKIGAQGDFITAPEYTDLFGKTLAHYISHKKFSFIMELGAGTGKLAKDILLELERLDQLPTAYWILEVSADLTERQKVYLQQTIPHLVSRITWLDTLPTKFEGIMIANEVLDALPVEKFQIKNSVCYEVGVGFENQQFIELLHPASELLKKYCESYVLPYIENRSFYQSEACLILPAWLKSIMESIVRGELLLIDYGYTASEYYHPQRYQGTLMCHYRHRAHSNPYQLLGLQDITTHVNFTYVMDSAISCGGNIENYQTQADFLLQQGITRIYEQEAFFYDEAMQLQQNQALKKLLMPQEMGEFFKVLNISK